MKIKIVEKDNGKLLVNSEYEKLLDHNGINSAKELWKLESDSVKNILKERGTGRCMLSSPQGREIETFIKRYQPIPIKEKIKNITSLKPYKFDGIHEFNAIIAFLELGLNTMQPIAAARFGDGRTCNLTLGITKYTRALEFIQAIENNAGRKVALIENVAKMLGTMHKHGMAHQDMYLVHLFVREIQNDAIFLIDLQRMIMQNNLKRRWRVKDLGQLLFSAGNFVSKDDIKLFWDIYTQHAGISPNRKKLINAIKSKAAKIRRHDEKRRIKLNLGDD